MTEITKMTEMEMYYKFENSIENKRYLNENTDILNDLYFNDKLISTIKYLEYIKYANYSENFIKSYEIMIINQQNYIELRKCLPIIREILSKNISSVVSKYISS